VKYIPAVLILLAIVYVMAGAGRKGARAGESIVLVIIAFLVLAILFGLVVARTL
jgi:hypothetical protein